PYLRLTPTAVSFHTIATSGWRFTKRSSACLCVVVRTQPCSVTNLRVVVTHTLVSRNRLSARIAATTRSLISGSRLYAPPHSQVPARQHDVPRSTRLCAVVRLSCSVSTGGFAAGQAT